MKACTGFTACLYGIDAGNVRLHRDERHNALYVDLDDGVHIRVDLNNRESLGRDLDGLRRLAEVAAEAAQEIEQLQRDGAR